MAVADRISLIGFGGVLSQGLDMGGHPGQGVAPAPDQAHEAANVVDEPPTAELLCTHCNGPP